MPIFVLLGCRDPIVRELDGIAVPVLDTAEAGHVLPRIGMDFDGILVDLGADRRSRVPLEPSEELLVPALAEALGDWRGDLAIVADARLPYRDVVRVLFTVGAVGADDDVELVVSSGVVVSYAPRSCGAMPAPAPSVEGPPVEEDPPALDRGALLRLLAGDPGPCVWPTVTEADGGLRVVLSEVSGGCGVPVPGAVPDGWRGAVAIPSPGACPSVAGRDPAALQALLARTASLGEPCEGGLVAPADETSWGDALALLVATRSRHRYAGFGLAREEEAGCADGWVLP